MSVFAESDDESTFAEFEKLADGALAHLGAPPHPGRDAATEERSSAKQQLTAAAEETENLPAATTNAPVGPTAKGGLVGGTMKRSNSFGRALKKVTRSSSFSRRGNGS